ncbi:MAG: hypothetical protein CM1200mP2_19170 [Planctomycetaceae bacterium]|nr:MAG: hypothetical protein CM1200mP2_19170 [Planctomycetaceae bacterium]
MCFRNCRMTWFSGHTTVPGRSVSSSGESSCRRWGEDSARLLFRSSQEGTASSHPAPGCTIRPRRSGSFSSSCRLASARLTPFDHKPAIAKHAGKKITGKGNVQDLLFREEGSLMPSEFRFRQHGESGKWVSELFPHLARTLKVDLHPFDGGRCKQPRAGTVGNVKGIRPSGNPSAGAGSPMPSALNPATCLRSS